MPRTPSPIPIDSKDFEREIDELGELQRQIDLMDPVVERHKVLKEKLEDHAKAAPADAPVVFRGRLYQVHFGPRRRERTITNPKKAFAALKKALGAAGVLAAIDIALGLIDKHVPESEQKSFIHEERSGWRKLDVVALTPPAPPRAA